VESVVPEIKLCGKNFSYFDESVIDYPVGGVRSESPVPDGLAIFQVALKDSLF
jgi:hypothetical protein